jgi:hypothetical protein
VRKRRDVALTVALAVAGAAFGIGAEVAAGAPQGRSLAYLDAAVGMLLLGFGATAHLRRPGSLTGVWLVLAGLEEGESGTSRAERAAGLSRR